MVGKYCFKLQFVDDLKAADLSSDQWFKDIIISIGGTFISAFSNIMPTCQTQ